MVAFCAGLGRVSESGGLGLVRLTTSFTPMGVSGDGVAAETVVDAVGSTETGGGLGCVRDSGVTVRPSRAARPETADTLRRRAIVDDPVLDSLAGEEESRDEASRSAAR